MPAHNIQFSLKFLCVFTAVICVASAIGAAVLNLLLAILCGILGIAMYHELEFSESRVMRVLGVVIYVVCMVVGGGLLLVAVSG